MFNGKRPGPDGPFRRRRGVLLIGGVPATALARRFGTPLYAMDEGRIRQNVRRLHAAFASRADRFRIHYAVKANNNLAVLAVIRQEGCGADCSTPAEISLARRAGFETSDLLYSGNFQRDDELAAAIRERVVVNLDDDRMLPRLLRHGRPPVLSFRVNPGVGAGGFRGLVFGGAETKFGISEARARAGYAAARRAGLRRFGLHMMAGSNVLDRSFFGHAVAALMRIAGGIARRAGVRFEFINIGGGFGVAYRPSERPLDVESAAEAAVSAFREGRERHRLGEPKLLIEPGRYLVCDSTALLAQVTWVKRTNRTYVGTDAGMQTLLRPALYGAYHPIVVANRVGAGLRRRVHVCGPICENTDLLARDRLLRRVAEGDLLAILNTGAYGFAMASQYNSRPRPAEVLAVGGRAESIRAREGVADLSRGVRIPLRLKR